MLDGQQFLVEVWIRAHYNV